MMSLLSIRPTAAGALALAASLATAHAVQAAPAPLCEGDANGDLRVDFGDITTTLTNWLGAGPEGDANEDGIVDFADISAAITRWGDDCAARFTRGSAEVAKRIVGGLGEPCRLYMVGDSLSSDSYGQNDTTNTAFHYGIVRTWRPPNWSGMLITSNGLAGDRYSFATLPQGGVRTGGANIPGIGYGLLPTNATEMIFYTDASPHGAFQQFFTVNTGQRYGVGAWTANRALVARMIYLAQPDGVPVSVRAWRPPLEVVAQQDCNEPDKEAHITFVDVPIAAGPEGDVGAGAYGVLPDINEFSKRFTSYGCRIFDPANPGFELAPAGIGGSTPRDHTRLGSIERFYSDWALTQFLAALESNTFWVMLGQNQFDYAPLAPQLNAGDPTLYRQYMEDVVSRYREAAIAAGVDRPLFLLVNTHRTTHNAINQETRWRALAQIASNRDDTLALDLYEMAGTDVAYFLVDGVHCNHAGSERFARMIWQTLTALANREN